MDSGVGFGERGAVASPRVLLHLMPTSLLSHWPPMSLHPVILPFLHHHPSLSAQTCLERLRRRARSEEGGIQLGYLQQLHAQHQHWLVDRTTE